MSMDSTDSLMRASEPGPEVSAAARRDQAGATITAPILVAVDMSGESRAALIWACKYAQDADAPVLALHALHDPPEAPGKYNRDRSDPFMPMVDTAESMLREFLTEMRANHPELKRLATACSKVVEGLPARRIVDEALRLNARLIVMGSRGQTGLPRLMNGSVAQRVLQLSPIPVTLVKTQE